MLPDIGPPPAILVSYVYRKAFLDYQSNVGYRDWVLDSGAFTAHTLGKPVELAEFIEFCTYQLAIDQTLTEVFALDVIGDWKATLKNTERMWEAGIPAIPAYHAGQPVEALDIIARDYPKIAFGGAVGLPKKKKLAFAQAAMARIWPKPVHGFGFGNHEHLANVPFHSCDATNWEIRAVAFGIWRVFGKMSVRGKAANVRSEIDAELENERFLQHRWAGAMKEIADQYSDYATAIEKARS
jgi:hypothetical protein